MKEKSVERIPASKLLEENVKSLAKQENLRSKLEELARICDDQEEIEMIKKIMEELDNGT